ncbi:FAD-binding oxidoreductase [Actinoalloteichus caeruleus]|uniref:FAD/FMN-containing dehydrogenase n=1 Tax=Actinoalloteichus caeruleus DSM 43889 TaxID=1120930 RepID=A0ABT1JFU0_ACTCY|nr:FAD-binding oxidoreductase [Actinoalloteichus caeruleus]MCP2331359.1 FAD/FMN-containing dehydrogenase [Actinoalloteichus caeruleus DSM 43889]
MTTSTSAITPVVATLRAEVAGPVLLPEDPGFATATVGFQTYGPHRPDVAVLATTTADVRAAVRVAADHDLPVAVLNSGHGVPPRYTGGLLVATRDLAGVRVDPGRRVAWIEAGAPWSAVIEAAGAHGLAPLSGSTPHVGAVGYTLGGGLGLLARRFGYAADHVREIELVTADGTTRSVTARTHPDLFWASRGGGGNFGVVTGMEVDLFPVPTLYGGGLFYDAPLVGEALRAWRDWTSAAPEEITTSVALVPFPDVDGVPDPLRGRHVLHVRIAATLDVATGDEVIAPLRAVGPRLLDAVGELPYTDSATICSDPTEPMGYQTTNLFLDGLPDQALSGVLDRVGPGAPSPQVLEIRHLGGALRRPPAEANCVSHRDAEYLLGLTRRTPPDATPEQAAALRAPHAEVRAALRPWSTGASYLNFLDGDGADTERVRSAYTPENYRRLADTKARWDPRNLFRHNRNVPPTAPTSPN